MAQVAEAGRTQTPRPSVLVGGYRSTVWPSNDIQLPRSPSVLDDMRLNTCLVGLALRSGPALLPLAQTHHAFDRTVIGMSGLGVG